MVAAPASNAEFLNGIFGTLQPGARPAVCGFSGHPKTGNWTARPWQPGTVVDGPGLNWYFTLAVHRPDANGAYERKRANCAAVYGVMLDDIGTTAAPRSRLDALPPSALVQTSKGNYQALYLFPEPVPLADLARVEALQDSLVVAGLCDPGAKGPATRNCRMPFGVNGKHSPPQPGALVEWRPDLRHTIEQITRGLALPPLVPKAPRESVPVQAWESKTPEDQRETIGDLRSALAAVPSDDRETWVRVGHYLRALPDLVGYTLFEKWSRKAENFDEDDIERFWGFAPDRVDYRAVFSLAKEHGWINPRSREAVDLAAVFAGPDAELPAGASRVPPAPALAAPVALPEWVSRVREWTPPDDLDTRAVVVEFAVDGWIQAGKVGVLVAAGGTGKTTLLLVLGICIALGRPFFGCRVKRGSFVLLSNDDSQDDLNGALARVVQAMPLTPQDAALVAAAVRVVSMQGSGGLKTFTAPGGSAPNATGLEDVLTYALEGIPDLVGVALDTLRQFSGGSSNDEQVMKLTIEGATTLARKVGAFVILPHHTGKQNYREGVADQYAASGSAAISDNSRFVLLLQSATWADVEKQIVRPPHATGSPLVLTSTRGSLLVRSPAPMFLHRDGFKVERLATATLSAGEQETQRDREILQAVQHGMRTGRAIKTDVGGNDEARASRIQSLMERGLLTNEGSPKHAQYSVTSDGAQMLVLPQVLPARQHTPPDWSQGLMPAKVLPGGASPLGMGITEAPAHD